MPQEAHIHNIIEFLGQTAAGGRCADAAEDGAGDGALMEHEGERTVSVTVKFTESEAVMLMNFCQNPPEPTGRMSMMDQRILKDFFTALNDGLGKKY